MKIKMVPFSKIFADVSGGNLKVPKSKYNEDGRIPVIDQGKEYIGGYVDDAAYLFKKDRPPIIIFGDHTRCFKYVDHEFAMGADGVKVLKPKHSQHAKYLYHFLKHNKIPDTGYNRHFKYLKRITIPLPSLADQERIASILDKTDTLREKRRKVIAKLDELLQSVFLDMFGDPVPNPKEWNVEPLAKVVKKDTIVTYGIVQAGKEYKGGVPYIRTGDIVDGEIQSQHLRHTDPAIASRFQRSMVREGEIVMSIRATVGTNALIPKELDGANLTQGTARISPGDQTTNRFLLNFFRSKGAQSWIQRQIKGATFREITLARLREMPVFLPPLKLQERFTRLTLKIETIKRKSFTEIDHLSSLFESLQQRAFKGEL